MKIKKSQLKQIIKEEIKRIVNEQGIRQPGGPMTTSIGHELRMDRDEPLEAPAVGGGAGFEEMRRQAGLSGAEGEETRTDAPEGYELPEEEKLKDEEEQGPEQAFFGQAPAVNPPGSYASAAGGIPQWNVTRAGEMVPAEGSGFFGDIGGPPEGYTYDPSTGEFRPQRESRQRKLQRIIEEELQKVLNEGPLQIPQDIPTGGAPPPPRDPVFTRTGQELTPEYLQSLGMPGEPGYESPEEYFEQNPDNRPVEVAEPETDPVYGVVWDQPVGDPAATRYLHMVPGTAGVPSGGGTGGS